MTTVEKVARALCAASDLDWDAQARFETSANGDEDGQAYYLELARAALSAMLEPSEGMLDQGVARSKDNDDQLCDTDYGMVFMTYRAMIQAALSEEG